MLGYTTLATRGIFMGYIVAVGNVHSNSTLRGSSGSSSGKLRKFQHTVYCSRSSLIQFKDNRPHCVVVAENNASCVVALPPFHHCESYFHYVKINVNSCL